MLVQQKKLKKMKEQKKIADPCKLSRKGSPNPIARGGSSEGVWVFTEEMLQKVSWARVSVTGPEDPLHNRQTFIGMICCVNM